MVTGPGETPVTIPADKPVEPTVATPVLLLAHVPPVIALPKVMVAPGHTCVAPVIAPGEVFTVIVFVA